MGRTVISVEKLGKEYSIGGRQDRSETFREMLLSASTAPFRLRKLSGQALPEERIWALKNVNFEVKEGEVVGIIGRNGAGKSTLLKILSRITDPTEGRVTLRGRVSSLLEVGTGFHPELTGRENIYLNGAILGMSRAEIDRKFGDIVDFSGVKKFLDTPIKRYSSGMSVRLAFAVAAHLEPEILVVDEVLAVGDAEFQNKCLGKMKDVAAGGRTVLFVSHNMGAVRALCSRGLALAGGHVLIDASADGAVRKYLENLKHSAAAGAKQWGEPVMSGDGSVCLRRVTFATDRSESAQVATHEEVLIRCEYDQLKSIDGMRINIQLMSSVGEIAFTTSDHSTRDADDAAPGRYISRCSIPSHLLNTGRYFVRLSLDIPGSRVIQDWLDVGSIEVVGPHNGGTTYRDKEWPGVCSPRCSWVVTRIAVVEQEAHALHESL